MARRTSERWRCLTVGCNPRLNAATAENHSNQTGHRTARWPVRSAEGRRRQRERNARQWSEEEPGWDEHKYESY